MSARPAFVAFSAALTAITALLILSLLSRGGGSPVHAEEPYSAQGIVVGGAWTYTRPWSSAPAVRFLTEGAQVNIVAVEYGENWVVGDQTWYMADQGWTTNWYVLEDGSYVYSAFVFVLYRGEVHPWYSDSKEEERYIVVDLSDQLAWAMLGPNVMHQMPVTSGRGEFATPPGNFRVLPAGRIVNERMRSVSAGITDPNEFYDVERVLFTQYFAADGYALHMNYWRPQGVFGNQPTSHGCIGLLIHDAQYLWLFGYTGIRVEVRQ